MNYISIIMTMYLPNEIINKILLYREPHLNAQIIKKHYLKIKKIADEILSDKDFFMCPHRLPSKLKLFEQKYLETIIIKKNKKFLCTFDEESTEFEGENYIDYYIYIWNSDFEIDW